MERKKIESRLNINRVFLRFVKLTLYFLTVLMLTSCSLRQRLEYNHVESLFPEVNADFKDFVKVNSLQPTFKWKLAEEGLSEPDYYEFIILEFSELRPIGSVWNVAERKFHCGEYINTHFKWDCYLTDNHVDSNCKRVGEFYELIHHTAINKWDIEGFIICAGSGEPYYVRKVKGTEHTVEKKLMPKTRYLWTVRPVWEKTNKIGKWGSYNSYKQYELYAVLNYTSKERRCKWCAFPFETQ